MKKRRNPTEIINKVNEKLTKKPKKYPSFKVGDTVRIFVKVTEGEKTRLQPFEGIVIKKRGGGVKSSFTVRKISSGVGVERIFPYFSPVIDRIMLISEGQVRRAKLYYLRELRGRKGRIKSEYVYRDTEAEEPEETSSAESGDSETNGDVSAQAAGA